MQGKYWCWVNTEKLWSKMLWFFTDFHLIYCIFLYVLQKVFELWLSFQLLLTFRIFFHFRAKVFLPDPTFFHPFLPKNLLVSSRSKEGRKEGGTKHQHASLHFICPSFNPEMQQMQLPGLKKISIATLKLRRLIKLDLFSYCASIKWVAILSLHKCSASNECLMVK